jgi:hypothetical protein
MRILFSNNAVGTLTENVPASSGYVTIKVNSELIALLPSISVGDFFVMTLTDPEATPEHETVKVTNVSSNDLTVVRDWDGTGLGAFDATTSSISGRLTAKALTDTFVKMNEDAPLTDASRVAVDSKGLLVDSAIGHTRVWDRQTATEGQTDFTINGNTFSTYSDSEEVYVNGVRQINTEDYSISGNDIQFTAGLRVGSIVDVSYLEIT